MKIEDFKIYQFHFGTNCITLCMCFLASKLELKFETPPSWAQIWACDWARSQVELVCEMHWVWVHRLSKIFPKFKTKSQLLSLTQGSSLFMKPAPDFHELRRSGLTTSLTTQIIAAMGYVSSWMGDRLSALLVSLMALWLVLVDQNPFWPCSLSYSMYFTVLNILFCNPLQAMSKIAGTYIFLLSALPNICF